MSVSQYKSFDKCEAQALAALKNEYEPFKDSTPLLVGNYVHSYFESEEAHLEFLEENKEKMMSSRKPYGLLKSYQVADDMIKKLENDKFFNFLYQGEKEHVLTGKLFGTDWKARIDCLNVEKSYFVDIKTTADMSRSFWSDKYGYRVSFVEEYGYVLQMAVYKKLLEQKFDKEFTPYIFAVSKTNPIDIEALRIEQAKLDFELNLLERNIDRVIAVKTGQSKPERCGKCDYCISTKQIAGFKEIDELIRK